MATPLPPAPAFFVRCLRTAFEVLRLRGIQEDRIFAGAGASCSGTAIDVRAGLGQAPRGFFFETSEGDSLTHRLHFWGSRGVWDNMLARFRLHLEGLGVHWTPFGHHFGDLGDAWGAPKALLGPLGAPCGIPVPPWGPPGVLWGPPGGILGGSGGHFGAILGAFGGPKWTKKSLKFGPETRSYFYHVLDIS